MSTHLPAPAATIAETIAAAMGDDGTAWHTADGRRFDDLLAPWSYTFERHPHRPDVYRYVFPDGSVITTAGDAWDLGFPTCWCWQGAPGDWHPASGGECDCDPRDREA